MRYYGNFCIEEHEKIVKFLSRMIEEGHLERDVNSNLIRTLLKTFIDSNFTTHEECFAEVLLDHLKIISAWFMENKMSCADSVASSKHTSASRK